MHHVDREAGEGGGDDAVPEHPGEKVRGTVDPVDLPVAVDGAEQCQEHDRQREREERRLPAAPEQALLVAQLVGEQAVHSPSPVSSR